MPSALELLDRHCLTAVNDWKNLGLEADSAAILLARLDAPGAAGDGEAAVVLACFEGSGATWAARSTDPDEADALFAARRLAYPAVERLGPVLTEDVCVPRSRVPAMLLTIEEIAARHGASIATIAHAGDGNLHPLLITPPGDEAQQVERFLAGFIGRQPSAAAQSIRGPSSQSHIQDQGGTIHASRQLNAGMAGIARAARRREPRRGG